MDFAIYTAYAIYLKMRYVPSGREKEFISYRRGKPLGCSGKINSVRRFESPRHFVALSPLGKGRSEKPAISRYRLYIRIKFYLTDEREDINGIYI